jgi:hypothetical protein
MKRSVIPLTFIAVLASSSANAETLTDVSSWRDVSEFMQRHDVSEIAAALYVAETCEALPSMSRLACLTQAITSPSAFEGLSTEWLATAAPRIAEQEALIAEGEARAEASRASAEAEWERYRNRIAQAARASEIAGLVETIEQYELARQGVLRTVEQQEPGELSEQDQEQIGHILQRYAEDIAQMKARLIELQRDRSAE